MGDVVGAYRLEDVLGRGGMGVVYRATHRRLGRTVAIKILSQELAASAEFVSRFFHEARIVAEINHPSVIDIIDFIELENPRLIAYVMELLRGDSLKGVLGSDALSTADRLSIAQQIATALSIVHERGVVHRDLKPANVFVLSERDALGRPCAKLIDFGIAKVLSGSVEHETQRGVMLGTPAYMAPEQVAGAAVGPPADVYAWGEVAYEILAREPVFRGNNNEVLMTKLTASRPPLPRLLTISPQIGALINRTLDRDPAARPPIAEVLAALATHGSSPAIPSVSSRPLPAQPSQNATAAPSSVDTTPALLTSQTVPRRARVPIGTIGAALGATALAILAGSQWMSSRDDAFSAQALESEAKDEPVMRAVAAPLVPKAATPTVTRTAVDAGLAATASIDAAVSVLGSPPVERTVARDRRVVAATVIDAGPALKASTIDGGTTDQATAIVERPDAGARRRALKATELPTW